MIKHLFSIIVFAFIQLSASAQTVKTGVLVIGNTAGSVAASIQSARSGAKTVLLTQTSQISPELTPEDLRYLERIRDHFELKTKRRSQTRDSIAPLDTNMSKTEYASLIKSITDTTKNLTVTLNSPLEKIEKDGKGWEIRLKNGRKIKADAVVDATENLTISSILRIDANKTMTMRTATSDLFESRLYRSTVAAAYSGSGSSRSAYPVPLGAMIPVGVENFVIVPKNTDTITYTHMSTGQAAGTIASYCAFFKTTTRSINVRVVQGELLAFGAELISLSDIKRTDPNFLAFQRMSVSGLLRPFLVGEGNHNVIKFDTVGTISSEQLRAPMREFYSRSQIWFADNKKEVMTIDDVISLFMFTATRGNELKKEIEDGWKASFKFNSQFDSKRPITRKEFAVLADRYLQPFNTRVDFAGNLLS